VDAGEVALTGGLQASGAKTLTVSFCCQTLIFSLLLADAFIFNKSPKLFLSALLDGF